MQVYEGQETRSTAVKLTKVAVDAAKPLTLSDGSIRQRLYFDTELTGFGLCVGADSKSYFARRSVNGKTRHVTIGRHGVLTVDQARRQARDLLLKMGQGINPHDERRKARAKGFTLREALELYQQTLQKEGAKQRTIEDYKYTIEKYLADWLDRALADITRDEADKRHGKIAADIASGKHAGEYENGRKRKRADGQGKHTANAVMRNFRAVYNRAMKAHPELPVCPTINVTWFDVSQNKKEREKKQLPLSRLHDWHKQVVALDNTIRRDYLLFTLHTGLRRGDATTARWEHVDFARKVLHVPEPKGGEAFDLPLTDYLVKLLKARKKENDKIFDESPWVFPAVSDSGHISEPREDFDGIKWTPHDTRRWFQRAAESLDISPYAIKMLVNHKLPGGDITAKYLTLELERLRPVMEQIGAKLRALCKVKGAK